MPDPSSVIRFPTWEQPISLQTIEQRIDSALSSSNGWLNALLSPVRWFVHDVLHPVLYVGDLILAFVWNGVKWVFSGVQSLAYSAIWAVNLTIEQITGFATNLYGAALDYAKSLADAAIRIGGDALRVAVSTIRTIIDDVSHYLTTLISNLRSWAESAIGYAVSSLTTAIDATRRFVSAITDDLRNLIGSAVSHATDVLRGLIDDTRSYFGDVITDLRKRIGDVVTFGEDQVSRALDVFYDDVVRPGLDALHHAIDTELRWATDLLQVVADAADWLAWVTRRVVPDAIDLWGDVQSWVRMDLDDLAAIAANGAGAA